MSGRALVSIGPAPLALRARTLPELAPLFLQWLGFVRQRRENTVLSYGEDLKMFLGFCAQAGLSLPDEITFRHCEFYIGWLRKERGLKASSANRHLHCLRSFWRWMVREGISTVNPAADCFMLPTQKKLPGYLTVPEQERVLSVLAEDRSLLGRRDEALVATALFTGLRCAELAALQVQHVDLDAGRLRVVQGKGQKDRELPIIPRLEAILHGYLEDVRPQLLGRPMGSLSRRPGARSWALREHVDGGRRVHHNLGTASRSEAERRRAEMIPLPPLSPFVFVNAHRTGSGRRRRAGEAILGKSIFRLVRETVGPIVGRPVHPHQLRHSFASRLRENGADLQDIQEALGHASINTTTMYAHLTTRRRREKLAELLK